MDENFNLSRLEFYMGLREDPIVQELGIEEFIRDYTEKIISYNKQANTANRVFSENYQDLFLDFRDVKDISYSLGTGIRNSIFQKLIKNGFILNFPLSIKLNRLSEKYSLFENKGILSEDLIDDDIVPHVHKALDETIPRQSKEDSIKQLFEKADEYLDRMQSLFTLSHSEDNLKKLYKEFFAGCVALGPEFSNILSNSDIRKISNSLLIKTYIDDISFRVAYLAALRGSEDEDPVDCVNKFSNEFMYALQKGNSAGFRLKETI